MRIALVVVLVLLVVVGAFVHAFWPREEGPRSDVEEVMRVHADFVEALIDGDHDEVWDLLASGQRESIGQYLELARKHPDEDFGFDAGELRSMDARTFLEVGLERFAERHPENRSAEIALLRALRIREVEMRGDRATVRLDEADWWRLVPEVEEPTESYQMTFMYLREDGAWRFGSMASWSMKFKTLEMKVETFLPKADWPELAAQTQLVVTIGSEGLADEARGLLTARLREWARDEPTLPVLLDAAAGVSWGSVVRAVDAIHVAGYGEVRLAEATAAGPEPGVRVNGVPVSEPFDAPGSDKHRTAPGRTITIGDQRGRPVELRLVCPNRDTVDGVPWVFETTFTNRGADEVRMPSMRTGDPGVRLVLVTFDPEAAATVEPEARSAPELPEPSPEERDWVTINSAIDEPEARVVIGVPDSSRAAGTGRIVLRPGEGRTRLDVVPQRPGRWTIRAEAVDESGRWFRSNDVWLGPPDEPPVAGPAPAALRLAGATGAGIEGALVELARIVRTDPEPSLRLLAALCARHLDEEAGLLLLRELADGDSDAALGEAAAAALEPR